MVDSAQNIAYDKYHNNTAAKKADDEVEEIIESAIIKSQEFQFDETQRSEQPAFEVVEVQEEVREKSL